MKITYWTTTILLAHFLLWSTYTYLFSKSTIEGVKALGFPDFFRIQLAILKLLAIVVLLIPAIPLQIKEWAYAGVGLFFLTAIVAHIVHKDPIVITVINVGLIATLIISNIYLHKMNSLIN